MPTLSNIRFPVIRSVEITGYALFPGKEGTGLSHVFENGVSVVAGINGLGKTTLLVALLRLLIGPWDVPREDPEDVGSTRHELIPWRNPTYFSTRVPDDALSATISGRISFGDVTVFLTRSLRDLSIRALYKGDTQLRPHDDEYQKLVVDLCGVSSFYDFHFLVRNLIFYLEDRRPIIWTDDAQFEVIRILFVPSKEAIELVSLYDEVKRVDSRYRNLLTETNRTVRRLNDRRRAEGAKESNLAAISTLKAAFSGEQEALDKLDSAIDQTVSAERAVAAEIRRAQLDLESAMRDFEHLQQDYFARAFPKHDETFHYIFAHLVSNGGCLVCGSAATEKADELRLGMQKGRCPVCDSPPERQERVVASSTVAAERVNRAAQGIEDRQRTINVLEEKKSVLLTHLDALLDERRRHLEELDSIRSRLAALGGRLPASSEAVTELETSVKVNQERLTQLLRDRTEGINRYRQVMQSVEQRILSAHGEIIERCISNRDSG